MTTKKSKTTLRQKTTSKTEINKYNFNFQGNQKKTMRQSIFHLRFQLKKQNNSSVNKYTEQYKIQKRFTDFYLLMHRKELVVKGKFERLKFTNRK